MTRDKYINLWWIQNGVAATKACQQWGRTGDVGWGRGHGVRRGMWGGRLIGDGAIVFYEVKIGERIYVGLLPICVNVGWGGGHGVNGEWMMM